MHEAVRVLNETKPETHLFNIDLLKSSAREKFSLVTPVFMSELAIISSHLLQNKNLRSERQLTILISGGESNHKRTTQVDDKQPLHHCVHGLSFRFPVCGCCDSERAWIATVGGYGFPVSSGDEGQRTDTSFNRKHFWCSCKDARSPQGNI